jgi:hypothetical protein
LPKISSKPSTVLNPKPGNLGIGNLGIEELKKWLDSESQSLNP